MKKTILAISATLMIAAAAQAQDGTAFEQGKSTVAVGYGFGNIWKTLMKLGGESVKATGPFALTYEYGVAEHISAGVSLGYSKITGTTSSNYEETLTNISALARANYHFGSSEKFDPYLGIGLGYYNFKWTDNSTGTTTPVFSIPGAFGFSGQLGAKYYFSSNIGAYAEIGYVGGSLAQIGLTAKF